MLFLWNGGKLVLVVVREIVKSYERDNYGVWLYVKIVLSLKFMWCFNGGVVSGV